MHQHAACISMHHAACITISMQQLHELHIAAAGKKTVFLFSIFPAWIKSQLFSAHFKIYCAHLILKLN
jgi:hypothetical protein